MTNKCVVFAGGEPVSKNAVDMQLVREAYVISADKGYDLAAELGISSDLVIGDFDSVKSFPQVENIIKYPSEKDDTDLMLALKAGLEKGCDEFVIYGATGGRLDHMIGNIQSLMYLISHGAVGKIVSDREIVQLLAAGSYSIPKREGFSLSLTAYSEKVCGLCIAGAKYNVNDCELSNDFPLGISNEIAADFANISFKKGVLLVIQSALFTDF